MRRLLLIFCLVGLVLASLAVGVLAADWPFWQRAWQWHAAAAGWPEQMPGSWLRLGQGPGQALADVDPAAAQGGALGQLAARHSTQALLVARGTATLAQFYGPGVTADTLLQGRGLTELVLAPLYGVELAAGRNLLDQPLAQWLPEWRGDPRGEITPRQLMTQLSGLRSPRLNPFNPFSDRARLASGPNFERAALGFTAAYPPGSHFEPSPANAQLLAVVLTRSRGVPLTQLLEQGLWQPLGAGGAEVALDRLGGDMAAHCCLKARARDWLRLARLLADDGRLGAQRLLPAGYVAALAQASPVHPGYGLGLAVSRGNGGQTLLWARSRGRLVLVVPEQQLAAVWFAGGELDAAAESALRAALGL